MFTVIVADQGYFIGHWETLLYRDLLSFPFPLTSKSLRNFGTVAICVSNKIEKKS